MVSPPCQPKHRPEVNPPLPRVERSNHTSIRVVYPQTVYTNLDDFIGELWTYPHPDRRQEPCPMPTSATDICITLPGTLHKAAGGWWVIEIPKGWIATRVEVKARLERGKALRRRLAFEARQTPEGDP
jgi:hypothetical protein